MIYRASLDPLTSSWSRQGRFGNELWNVSAIATITKVDN